MRVVPAALALAGVLMLAAAGPPVEASHKGVGLGTAAFQSTGTSGANVPLMNGANTWSAAQIFSQYVAATYNSNGTYPAATLGGAIGSNFSGAQAEQNFWNTYTTATPAYSVEFEQLTGASAKNALMRIGIGGNGGLMIPKLSSAPSSAPGAGWISLYAIAGTTGGTCKLVSMSGTSTTPVTVVDNVGTGC